MEEKIEEKMKVIYAQNFLELVKISNNSGIKQDQIIGIYQTSNNQVVMVYYGRD